MLGVWGWRSSGDFLTILWWFSGLTWIKVMDVSKKHWLLGLKLKRQDDEKWVMKLQGEGSQSVCDLVVWSTVYLIPNFLIVDPRSVWSINWRSPLHHNMQVGKVYICKTKNGDTIVTIDSIAFVSTCLVRHVVSTTWSFFSQDLQSQRHGAIWCETWCGSGGSFRLVIRLTDGLKEKLQGHAAAKPKSKGGKARMDRSWKWNDESLNGWKLEWTLMYGESHFLEAQKPVCLRMDWVHPDISSSSFCT